MIRTTYKKLLVSSFVSILLSACFGRPAPINVKNLTTVINEDSSGSNSFRFAKPVGCEMLNFRPALDDFKSQFSDSSGDIIVSKFDDGMDAGWNVTVKFNSPEQIPAQIEGLKRGIVLTVQNNWTGTYSPDWDSLIATNENEFSVKVDHPTSTGQGKEWRVAITISPALLTTPEADCSYPEIDYEIVMPGKITSYEVKVKAYSTIFEGVMHGTAGGSFEEQLVKYAFAQKTHENTLLWQLRPKSIGEIMLESDGINLEQLSETMESATYEAEVGQLLYDHLNANDEERMAMEQLLRVPIQDPSTALFLITLKPIYTIKVNSATSMSPIQFLVNNITPIVILLGGITGVIFTIINIRQAILKRKEKA